jgi:hypothetical protein
MAMSRVSLPDNLDPTAGKETIARKMVLLH